MTFVQRCHELAASCPDAPAFTFLVDGEAQERQLTRGELETRALAVAQELIARGLRGQRVLLLYVPGLDFIVGLLGCLYAGAIAVPAYPPEPGRLQRTLPRLLAIIKDCAPALVLTTRELLAMAPFVFRLAPELAALTWAASEEWAAQLRAGAPLPTPQPPAPEDLAFLQYTSGSTAMPKGVMIGHDTLLAQLDQLAAFGPFEKATVSWLPFYHDMGLIGSILTPLYLGVRSVLMSPLDFLKRPLCWLQAIDRYRANSSPTPPFALDLCARKLRASDVRGLDLSCWRVIPIGAEPIPRGTLGRFSELLRPCGLAEDALVPSYGLAEAVLLVSGAHSGKPFLWRRFSAAALRAGSVVPVDAVDAAGPESTRDLVSCGQAAPGVQIEIVDPLTLRRCAPDLVGEIWVSGPNVARGYWDRPADSAATFGAQLAESSRGPFLRTGDLGFLCEGQLYVVSRIKDLIIIRGKNHHPSDLEQTVLASHPLLRPGCCAAFSVDAGAGEQLVVAAEVSTRELPTGALREGALSEINQAMRRAVSEQHELAIDTVVLLEPGQLPKTSSGKIMRQPTREELLAGRLVEVTRFARAPEVEASEERGTQDELPAAPTSRSYDALVEWLMSWLQRRLRAAAKPLTPELPFMELGLDSREAVAIAAELGSALGQPLPATALYDYPSITALARRIAGAEVRAAEIAPTGCAVLLAGSGSARPLFLLPGLFGVLSAFSQLSRELSAHIPLFGLDLPVHRGLPSPPGVPALAERYADELCAMAGAAPYRLLGYCTGGMVALEVARQLLQRGRAVEKLVLLDAPCLDAQRTDLAQLRKESGLTGERHAQLTLEQAVRLAVHHILGKQWAFGESRDLTELTEQMVRGGIANLSTFQGYEPQSLRLSATLISARERVRFPMYDEDATRNARRWSQLLGGSLVQLDAPGNHHSMLQAPHVLTLAQQLLTELARPDAAGQE